MIISYLLLSNSTHAGQESSFVAGHTNSSRNYSLAENLFHFKYFPFPTPVIWTCCRRGTYEKEIWFPHSSDTRLIERQVTSWYGQEIEMHWNDKSGETFQYCPQMCKSSYNIMFVVDFTKVYILPIISHLQFRGDTNAAQSTMSI